MACGIGFQAGDAMCTLCTATGQLARRLPKVVDTAAAHKSLRASLVLGWAVQLLDRPMRRSSTPALAKAFGNLFLGTENRKIRIEKQ